MIKALHRVGQLLWPNMQSNQKRVSTLVLPRQIYLGFLIATYFFYHLLM